MKFNIGMKVGVGYALAVVALAIIGMASFVSVQRLLITASEVEHTYKVLNGLHAILTDLVDIETGQRGYNLTGEKNFLEPYHKGNSQLETDITDVTELTKDNTDQREELKKLLPLVQHRKQLSARMVSYGHSSAQNASNIMAGASDGKRTMDSIRSIIARMQKTEENLLKERTDAANANAESTKRIISIGVPVAAGLLALIGLIIVRNISVPLKGITNVADRISSGDLDVTVENSARSDEIGVLSQAFARMVHSLQEMSQAASRVAAGNLTTNVRPQSEKDVLGRSLASMVENLATLIGRVQKSGIQVNTSATEIAATAKQQQATASEISATTSEISATSREISATSKELARAMKEVAEVAEETAELVTGGQAGLTRMEATMRQIAEASNSINAQLAVLNDKAGNITLVVTTITKVADQTNLLSLNAAIEAEKAGESGRGFAVVATEIRRLADQTAVATYDIEQIVKEMQSAVSAGIMGMNKFSEEVRRGVEETQQVSGQLTQIIEQVQTLTPNFESVNEGVQSQAVGAQQISEALTQLGETAQQTVESLRQSSMAIEQLNEATHGLQEGVSRFTLSQ